MLGDRTGGRKPTIASLAREKTFNCCQKERGTGEKNGCEMQQRLLSGRGRCDRWGGGRRKRIKAK